MADNAEPMGLMAVTTLSDWCRTVGVLALMLAALAVFGISRAEASEHGHHAAVAEAGQAAGHDHASGHAVPESGQNRHDDGGGCHCLSAACVPALPVTVSELRVYVPRARHAVPDPSSALALAGVDPPAEPPRL